MEKQLREEGRCSSPRTTKAQCIPRLRAPVATSSSCSARSHRFAPSSLLERFREAVLRLVMLSALSSRSPPPSSSPRRRPHYPVHDPPHSEDVADCIEFINRKKKVPDAGSEGCDSGGALNAPAEMVVQVPVM